MADGSPHAGLVTRAIAFALDAVLINLGIVALGAIIGAVLSVLDVGGDLDVGHILVGGAAWIALWGIYLTAFWALTGQTPGMWWMRIAVEKASGGAIGWCRAAARAAGTGLAVLPFFLGFLPILFTRRRRAANDFLAGTVVVYRTEERDVGAPSSRREASARH